MSNARALADEVIRRHGLNASYDDIDDVIARRHPRMGEDDREDLAGLVEDELLKDAQPLNEINRTGGPT